MVRRKLDFVHDELDKSLLKLVLNNLSLSKIVADITPKSYTIYTNHA